MSQIVAVLFLLAGLIGAVPYNEGPWAHRSSLSWALVFVAALLMLVGR